jgi:hypothetical protein
MGPEPPRGTCESEKTNMRWLEQSRHVLDILAGWEYVAMVS